MAYEEPDLISAGQPTSAAKNNKLVNSIIAMWKGTTAGDLDYYTSATEKARIPIGAEGDMLKVVGGVPTWGGGALSSICSVNNVSTSQTIAGSSADTLTWNNELIDDWGGHSNSVNNSRITIVSDGVYLPMVNLNAAHSGTSGTWIVNIVKNGSIVVAGIQLPGSSVSGGITGYPIAMVAGDYFTVYLNNDVGNTITVTYNYSHFSVLRIR